MEAYSQDLRDRVLRALARGERPSEIARRFEVSRVWVYQVRHRWEKDGNPHSLPMGGYRQSRLAPWESMLRSWLKAEVDLTLAEMCERLAHVGVQIKIPALWHQLNKWGLSFKKNPARQRASARRRATSAAGMAATATRTQRQAPGVSG